MPDNHIIKSILLKSLVLFGTPKSFQHVLSSNYDAGHRRNVLGLLIWETKYRLNLGYKQTTINPESFVSSVSEAAYIIKRLEGASRSSALNLNGLMVAQNLRRRTESDGKNALEGSVTDISKLRERIDTYLKSEMSKSDDANNQLDTGLLYELEGCKATDPKVLDYVYNSLLEDIESNLTKKRLKRQALSNPEDFATLLNLYQRLDALDVRPFLCSHTLRSILLYESIVDLKRRIHIGVYCTEDEMLSVRDRLEDTFQFTFSTFNDNSSHFIQLTHQNGLQVFLWRYETYGAYMLTKDNVRSFLYAAFDFRKLNFKSFLFRIPNDSKRYLKDQFGSEWETEKVYASTSFDYANTTYNNTPDALNFLTQRIVAALSKNHRRPATRAIEDLKDYFDIDFLPYIPVKDYNVTTPASRQRAAAIKSSQRPIVVLIGDHDASSSFVNRIRTVVDKHDHAIIVSFDIFTDFQKTALLAIKGVTDIATISSQSEWQSISQFMPNTELVMFPEAMEKARSLELSDSIQIVDAKDAAQEVTHDT